MYQHMVFKDPKWDYKTLNFDSDMARVDKIENGTINAMDPNLKPFFARGGKLIQYHGWADQQIPAGSSVEYYQSVLEAMGGAGQVSGQLSPVHGARHGALRRRRRDVQVRHAHAARAVGGAGNPPDRINASRVANGKPDRTRPLCPYPQTAVYKGSGSTDTAANFVCK